MEVSDQFRAPAVFFFSTEKNHPVPWVDPIGSLDGEETLAPAGNRNPSPLSSSP
jgi:hypothetical protein